MTAALRTDPEPNIIYGSPVPYDFPRDMTIWEIGETERFINEKLREFAASHSSEEIKPSEIDIVLSPITGEVMVTFLARECQKSSGGGTKMGTLTPMNFVGKEFPTSNDNLHRAKWTSAPRSYVPPGTLVVAKKCRH